MEKLYVLMLLFVSGCAAAEKAGEYGPALESLGESATGIGTTAIAFNPAIGLWIVAIGGVTVAFGKMLSLLRKKDNGEL